MSAYSISLSGINVEDYYVQDGDRFFGYCGKGKDRTIPWGPYDALAAYEYASNVIWEYENHTLILSGSGMAICRGNGGYDGRREYHSVAPYFPEYVTQNTHILIVQEGITTLDWILFNPFSALTTISLPQSLMTIDLSTPTHEKAFEPKHISKLTISKKLSATFCALISADQIEFLQD